MTRELIKDKPGKPVIKDPERPVMPDPNRKKPLPEPKPEKTVIKD